MIWLCAEQVLTTGSWPTQTAAKCNLPRELERCCEEFKAFYLASHSGRKLSWQTNMGHAGASLAPMFPPQHPSATACRLHRIVFRRSYWDTVT